MSCRVRPVTGWALLLAVLAISACTTSSDAGPPDTTAPTTTTSTSTTTTIPRVPWPLTGIETTDVAATKQPSVVVKVDNSPQARPQSGLAQADLVYEILVEGITRFALVLHSHAADPVGPVRSARSSDLDLLAPLGNPVFGWSGGNAGVVGEVRAAQAAGLLVDAGHDVASPEYWRDQASYAPHNLYTSVTGLRAAFADSGAGAPPPQFRHRPASAPVQGVPAAGVRVAFGPGVVADYVWDAARGGWARYQVDATHPRGSSATLDAEGVHIAPPNVVVLLVEYGASPSDSRSPMAITVGGGEAIVLSAGHLVRGTWQRGDPTAPLDIVDELGAPIMLSPGPTWVALPRAGSAVGVLDQPSADEIVALG